MGLIAVGKERKVRALVREGEQIEREQTDLSGAYVRLTQVTSDIKKTIEGLETMNLDLDCQRIDGMDLEADYKKSLKEELERSREEGMTVLKHLLVESEKLRGNMIVSQKKALIYLATLRARVEVYKVGELQLSVVKELKNQGEELHGHIRNLLAETERINNVTNSVLDKFNGQTSGFLEAQVAP